MNSEMSIFEQLSLLLPDDANFVRFNSGFPDERIAIFQDDVIPELELIAIKNVHEGSEDKSSMVKLIVAEIVDSTVCLCEIEPESKSEELLEDPFTARIMVRFLRTNKLIEVDFPQSVLNVGSFTRAEISHLII